MNENESSDQDLKARFQSLREFEAATAPIFERPIAGPAIAKPRSVSPYLLPLSAAALVCLVAIPAIMSRQSANRSLAASLPVLLAADPNKSSLFADLESEGKVARFYSDELLPFHLTINL